MKPLELWGGHECSVLRVGDRFRDQTVLSGHQHRLADLESFAGLGLTCLRYPALWERISPDAPGERDFTWTDERLGEIRRLGLRPVLGLLHHGNGPRYTNLLAPNFATGLAAHARAVAERYPWVEDWNPVNEPLTTARFACLYGSWYPHRRRDEGAFWAALLNEVNAVRLAMREIRAVNPRARLVQTDDLSFTHATRPMAAQAEFENHRRWITWDLLAGRVTPDHPLWVRIASFGLHDRMHALAEYPCPADMIGVNYYVPSERLLDHDTQGYSPTLFGQDSPGEYVNVAAVQGVAEGTLGIAVLLRQAWERYRTPVGVLETHNVGTRDEMMRWVLETWCACETLRREGVGVEAMTAWSLLGAFDWKSLGVQDASRYEAGVFDLKGSEPRPTALVPMLRSLAAGQPLPETPALASPGWWHRERRLDQVPPGRQPLRREELLDPGPVQRLPPPALRPSRPILVVGNTGMLGRALIQACRRRALPFAATDRASLQVEAPDSIRAALKATGPCAVINATGWSSIEGAEEHPRRCLEANSMGPENLARACKAHGIPLVTFSSDMVFDGTKGAPYVETDEPHPLNTYGRSKAEGERRVLATGGQNLVVRSATYFSPDDAASLAVRVLNDLAAGRTVTLPGDCFMSPTYVPDLADAVLDLLIDGETGIWHLTNLARMSWADFARTLAGRAGLDTGSIRAVSAREMPWRAPRPVDASLSSARGGILAEALGAIDRFLAETHHVAKVRVPEMPVDIRDPVLNTASH